MELQPVQRQLLNIIQRRFPLVERPFQRIGVELGLSEDEVLRELRFLKEAGLIRQISAIFDTRRLGYRSALVAIRCPPERLDEAAQHINAHPGVSQNYARDHAFNLWFTLAVPPEESLEATVERMARETGALAYHLLPAVRLFKIGVHFEMAQEEGSAEPAHRDDGPEPFSDWDRAEELSETDIAVVRELQEDLPLIARPFDAMGRRVGPTPRELLAVAQGLQTRGVLRRYGAVLHHRRAGFTANAMIVWRVPEERAEDVGRMMATFPWITHCYQRPTFPDWPYTHFTMTHAASAAKCQEQVQAMARQTGIDDYQMIFSTKEYKKVRVRYFSKEGTRSVR